MNRINWFRELYEVFSQIAGHRERYDWKSDTLGIDIIVFPGVFSPKYFRDSQWYASKVGEMVDGRSFLEVGSGTGLATVWAGLNGASSATATDINPEAVANTRENLRRHNLEGRVIQGDIYSGLAQDERFDIILWNHPFNLEYKPEEILLRAAFDSDFEGLQRYVAQAKDHLTDNGRLLLGSGNYAHPERVKEIAQRNGYKLEVVCQEILPLSGLNDFQNELFLYEFMRRELQ